MFTESNEAFVLFYITSQRDNDCVRYQISVYCRYCGTQFPWNRQHNFKSIKYENSNKILEASNSDKILAASFGYGYINFGSELVASKC